MTRLILKLAMMSTMAALVFANPVAAQVLPLAKKAKRVRIVSVAHFLVETLARLFAEVRHPHGVFRLFARALRHLRAICDFLLD